MPYIVTTRREQHIAGDSRVMQTITRRAVATLEDARQYCEDEAKSVCGHLNDPDDDQHFAPEWDGAVDAAQELPESGGTVGPLPDGIWIEVEHVRWDDLRERAFAAGAPSPIVREPGDCGQPVVDAFNARAEQ